MDFVLGNCGLNNQYKASPEKPLALYYDDFDKNGVVDPVLTYYIGNKSYPMFSRDEMLDQMVSLKRKFTSYASYANVTIEDIFGKEAVSKSPVLYCKQLSSIILENKGDFNFLKHNLPKDVQFSRISGVIATDIDHDGKKDLVMAGNFSPYRVQLGPCDASVGVVLRQSGSFIFESMQPSETGFWATGDIRYMLNIDSSRIVLSVNNGEPLVFTQEVPEK